MVVSMIAVLELVVSIIAVLELVVSMIAVLGKIGCYLHDHFQ